MENAMELTQKQASVQAQAFRQPEGFFKRLSLIDWLYGAALLIGALFALSRYGAHMDVYEEVILVLSAPTFAWLGWYWKPMRWFITLLAVVALAAIGLYGGVIDAAEQKFFLKYLLSSQS